MHHKQGETCRTLAFSAVAGRRPLEDSRDAFKDAGARKHPAATETASWQSVSLMPILPEVPRVRVTKEFRAECADPGPSIRRRAKCALPVSYEGTFTVHSTRTLASAAAIGICLLTLGTAPEVLAQEFAPVRPTGLLQEPMAEHPAACNSCDWTCGECSTCRDCGYFIGGADYLLVRPHFSEAVAFARGTQTAGSFSTEGEGLDFDYDDSFRAFIGYGLAGGCGELRFTYWNLQGDVAVNGGVGAPGEFIVDPFGNLVGAFAIIDPSDARGVGTILFGGAAIATRASVDVNIYDIDFSSQIALHNSCWELRWTAGARIADVEQFYDSIVTDANGAFVSGGEFFADFAGAGPRLGMDLRCGGNRFTLYANAHTSLLLGSYEVGATVVPVPGFRVEQVQSSTRLVPVLEAEVGAAWTPMPSLTIFGGWLFQGWLDMGTSGGTFGGLFNGADDANIMSFDGLTVRAEFSY